MVGHIIYENEIKSCQEAAGQLFSPESGKGDDRTCYQRIFHILEGCKDRFVDVSQDEKEEFHRAVKTIANYIVNHAVEKPISQREEYFKLAYGEVKRQIMIETRDEFAKR